LTDALRVGPAYESRLPVSFDASCSGLQHLCAMTRADEGKFVNLAPADVPQDVYDMVPNWVIERMRELDPNARLYFFLLKWKTDRSLLKRGVMTYFYNSEPYGMTDQLAKELDDQGYKHGRDYEIKALIYLVGHLRDAIGEILTRPQKV